MTLGYVPLNYIKNMQHHFMGDYIDIYRVTKVDNGAGGRKEESVMVYEQVKCRVSPPDLGRFAYRPQETVKADADVAILPFLLTVPLEFTVLPNDYFTWNGHRLEVTKFISGGVNESVKRYACKAIE